MNFIEQCLNGDLFEDEIDDFIEQWHEGIVAPELELHEALGMSVYEYQIWLTDPTIVSFIISARKHAVDLETELSQERYQLAARAENVEVAAKIDEWLKKIGKL